MIVRYASGILASSVTPRSASICLIKSKRASRLNRLKSEWILWSFLKMKQTNFTSVPKITIFIRLIFTHPTSKISNNGKLSRITAPQLPKSLCILVNRWVKIRLILVHSATCPSWCFQLLWIGRLNFGTQSRNRARLLSSRSTPLKVVKNTCMMSNGRLFTPQFLRKLTEMDTSMFGI